MDIINLLRDYNIDYITEGNKHCADGWIQVHCPFCSGSQNYHLGWNIQDEYWNCYRCGWHPLTTTIATLLNVSEQQTKKILRQYGILVPRLQKPPTTDIKKVEHTFPSGVGAMGIMHKIYLDNRKFDPEKLEKEWGLLGTGPVSVLDGIDYKFRIMIPFIWDGKQVSFDSRDITGKHPSKYMACPKHREIIPHKEILYGRQDKWKETGILVEGPTDVWRLGTSSFAVSGIKYTNQQVREIFRVFKRVAVVFDDDPQAVVQANKIVAELKFRGVDAFRIDIEGDPGGMPQDEADYLVKQLIK